MSNFETRPFTDSLLAQYQEQLRGALTRAKFILDCDALRGLLNSGVMRLCGDYTQSTLPVSLDNFINPDGTYRLDPLRLAISSGLSEPVIAKALEEFGHEDIDPLDRIGSGQLWVIHKTFPPYLRIEGGPEQYTAKTPEIHMLGQLSYDLSVLQNRFTARTWWVIARSNEMKKRQS